MIKHQKLCDSCQLKTSNIHFDENEQWTNLYFFKNKYFSAEFLINMNLKH